MRISSVRVGDLVEVNDGWLYLGEVIEKLGPGQTVAQRAALVVQACHGARAIRRDREAELIVRGPGHAPHRLRSRVAPDLCAFHGPPRVLDEAGASGGKQDRTPGFLLARAFDARLDVVGRELAADACLFDRVPERSAGEGSPVLVGASFDAFERFVSGDKSKMKLASHVDPHHPTPSERFEDNG